MGGGAFGIQAAAEFYFGKSVKDVTLSEAAMLAGLFKAPTKYAPHVNLPAARARANDVLEQSRRRRLHDARARSSPRSAVRRRRSTAPARRAPTGISITPSAKSASSPQDGKLGDNRVLSVRTTLDSNVQKRAEDVIEDQSARAGPRYHAKQSAAVVMEPDGAVRAIVGGRDYGASQFNRATDAARQPGSSFKPYVYLTALMTGRFKPTTIVTDRPTCIGNYCVHNYSGGYAGSHAARHGAGEIAEHGRHSTVAWRSARAIRASAAPRSSTPAGGSASPRRSRTRPRLPVGQSDVILLEHSAGYAAFVNGGKKVTPYAAVEIRNRQGDLLYRHDRDAPPQAAGGAVRQGRRARRR